MRAVIIADRSFASRERSLLSRLEIGLADEGVRVVHAVPMDTLASETVGLYSTAVGYQDRGLAVTRAQRVRRLVEALAHAAGEGADERVDLIHCFGGGAWEFSAELARQTGAPLVIEVDRADLIPHAASLAGPRHGNKPPVFCCPDPALVESLSLRAPGAKARSVPWGVHGPTAERAAIDPTAPVSAAILAEFGSGRALTSVLEAVARIGASFPGILLFINAGDSREEAVWKTGRKLGLLDRLSIVSDMEARREPILQADLLLLPDAAGRHHSLTLDAMAAGMVVVAAPDRMVSSLIDGRTARVVGSGTTDAWSDAIKGCLSDPDRSRQMALSASEWVRTERSVSAHVSGVLGVYAAVAGAPRAGATA